MSAVASLGPVAARPVSLSATLLALVLAASTRVGASASEPATIVVIIAAGIALALVGATWSTAWHVPAAWLALLAVSFTAALTLIDAPPSVAYQHFRLPPRDGSDSTAFAVLIAQLLLVLGFGWRALRDVLGAGGVTVRWPLVLLALGGAAVVGAAPSRDVPLYAGEIALSALIQVVALANITLVVLTVPAPTRVAAVVDRFLGEQASSRPDRWGLWLAACVSVVAVLLMVAVYERHPHVPDELVYLVHARYLAEGMLALPLPPVPAAFNVDLMHYDADRWFSPVPPGWPFVLAIGARFGVPWLVNPLLAGLAVFLAHRLLATMYDRRRTRLGTLLLASSPWFLFMGMNFMPHMLTLVCALGAGLGVAHARRTGAGMGAFVGGLATGMVSLIRPLEGLAVAMLVGLWSLGARGRAFRFAPSALLVAGSLLTGALVLPYNAALTGSPRDFPIMAYVDKYYEAGANDLGFGPNRGLGWSGLDPFPGHGVRDVVVNALLNGSQVNTETLGWPVGIVVLLVLGVALGRGWAPGPDRWHWTVIALVVGLHSFYWFSGGPDFGARYWFLIVVSLAALAASMLAGPSNGAQSANRQGVPEPVSRSRDARPAAAALALMVLALALFVPWRSAGKYHHYRGMRPDLPGLARETGMARSLVLVRGRRFPDYASAVAYNPIDLFADQPVYAWDATPELRSRLLDAYPDRPVYIVDGPSLTGRGYELRAGPLSAAEVLASALAPNAAGDEEKVQDPVNPVPVASNRP